ncbi:hypothetical protein HYY75_00480 [bacterium]|nr:hypothetical protein [bacterium]
MRKFPSPALGITTVELLIGLGIFLAVIIPIAAGFNFGARNTRSIKMRNEAIELLSSKMSEIMLMPFKMVDNDLVFQPAKSLLTGVEYHFDLIVTKIPQTYEISGFWDPKKTKPITYDDFKEIKLTIQWEEGGKQKALSLVSALGDKEK